MSVIETEGYEGVDHSADRSDSAQNLAELQELARRTAAEAYTHGNDIYDQSEASRRASDKLAAKRDESFDVAEQAVLLQELLGPEEARSDAAKEYLASGGSIDQLVQACTDYLQTGPVDPEVAPENLALRDSRAKLVGLVSDIHFLDRAAHRQQVDEAEDEYRRAMLGKIKSIFALDPSDRDVVLDAGHLPQVVEQLSLTDGQPIEMVDLAGNHMHVLVDLLCREQLRRSQEIENNSSRGLKKISKFFKSNKTARGALSITLLSAGVLGVAGKITGKGDGLVEATMSGLEYIGTYFAATKLLEGATDGIEDLVERREQKKVMEDLASSKELAQLALSTAYNSNESKPDKISDRQGTEDPEENKRRFKALDPDLKNKRLAPEYYEYDGTDTLPYVRDIFVNNRELVENIAAGENPEENYYALAELLINQDIARLRGDVIKQKTTRMVIRGISAAFSLVAGQIVDKVDGVKGFAQTTAGVMAGEVQGEKLPSAVLGLFKATNS